MGLQGLDYGLRAKLREYFHQTKHLRVALAHRRLISQMSPTLQSRITLMCNERWLRRVQFLDGAEEGFIIQLAIQLTAMVFAPGELAPTGYLYVVHRGIALYGGRVLTGGKVWGDDMILLNASLRRPWCARAMNYLEVFLISRDEMLKTFNCGIGMAIILRDEHAQTAIDLLATQGESAVRIGTVEKSETTEPHVQYL